MPQILWRIGIADIGTSIFGDTDLWYDRTKDRKLSGWTFFEHMKYDQEILGIFSQKSDLKRYQTTKTFKNGFD